MCSQSKFQAQIVAAFSLAMTSVKTVVDVALPNWSGRPAFDAAVDAATKAIADWKDGDPITQVVFAIDAVIAVVTSLSGIIPPQYVVVIDVALAGLKSILILLHEHNPAPTSAESVDALAVVHEKYAIGIDEPPTYASVRQYKRAWNHAIKPFPELEDAKL